METTQLKHVPLREPYTAPQSDSVELALQNVILDGSIPGVVEEDPLGWE